MCFIQVLVNGGGESDHFHTIGAHCENVPRIKKNKPCQGSISQTYFFSEQVAGLVFCRTGSGKFVILTSYSPYL